MSEATNTIHQGLEDVTVTETRLSHVDGEAGELIICGYPVAELAANATYEESVFLLFRDRLPTEEELREFRQELTALRNINSEVRAVLREAAATEKSAMDALRMGLAAANLGTDDSDDLADAKRVVAVLPTIVATYWRYRQDEQPLEPRKDLPHAANYYYMLTGEEADETTVRALETYLNTVVEHGVNASTFAARVVVSTESDLVSAATAAVGALKGPLHGGAPGPVLDTLKTVQASDDPEGYVRETLNRGDRLMGFGHRVYRVRDPRASVLAVAAERVADDLYETARKFEDISRQVLAEYKPNRTLDTNVEYYTAVLLAGVGIPRNLFTPTFAVARAGGWMAHCLEQRDHNRLVRPESRYVGATGRTWKETQER